MKRGFTLIETLIYLALFAIVITGLAATAYGYFETVGRNQTKAMLQEDGAFMLQRITAAMSGAKAVAMAGSTLWITHYDNTTDVVAFAGSDLTLNGAALNNSNILIGSGVFVVTSPLGVTTSFTISAKTPQGGTVTQDAEITNYVRK